ncbi:folylpolyglutamate synthase/dihydrofolate synthase family protein [Paenisporosarcina sp. OV554]|uniref:bifunctional folylpolyglutamate synthase/dihydrofolate synthase n=1 Tax=Paenisporosarcina sp. OV554 TaxID=2135694 RepID=UPI000D3631F7|nr:folylpolyglutamate synthase/dihydrofolate synthase family protein [Paenisporosarcina sp. OV554]PUB12318.1 dihydrofolate synthase/folylpolyglutamate synthase [Paenisporosarcina sp. OV554]
MFTSVDKVIEFIYSMDQKTERNGRLSRITAILSVLGNPHEAFRSVHIAGSNGKGSTLNALKEILIADGLQVGSFISPHLEKVNERIMMNDVMITDDQFVQYMNDIYPLLEVGQVGEGSNFFEILTVIAFMYYRDMKVDIALIETGIGGKFDSTNVITPLLSILTSISLDHTQILGDTIEAIAMEKAGIIKPMVPVISAVKAKPAVQVIENKATLEQAPIIQLYKDFFIENVMQEENQQRFTYQFNDNLLSDLLLKMKGHHQVENASLAISAALLLNKYYGFSISEDSIRHGLITSSWAARFEEVLPNVIIDGAHNPAGMEVLLQTIHQRYATKNIHVVFTALQDKDITSVLHMLDEIASSITVTEIHVKNAEVAKVIFEATSHPRKELVLNWQDALDQTLEKLDDSSIVLVTGSLYFMSLARPYLIQKAQAKVV